MLKQRSNYHLYFFSWDCRSSEYLNVLNLLWTITFRYRLRTLVRWKVRPAWITFCAWPSSCIIQVVFLKGMVNMSAWVRMAAKENNCSALVPRGTPRVSVRIYVYSMSMMGFRYMVHLHWLRYHRVDKPELSTTNWTRQVTCCAFVFSDSPPWSLWLISAHDFLRIWADIITALPHKTFRSIFVNGVRMDRTDYTSHSSGKWHLGHDWLGTVMTGDNLP